VSDSRFFDYSGDSGGLDLAGLRKTARAAADSHADDHYSANEHANGDPDA